MGNKLYVGGITYSVTEYQLQEIFSPHGTVESAKVITDRMTGRSRGFGFVEMSSDSEAQAAIEALNGTQLEGRSITVNEARPQKPRPLVTLSAGKQKGRRVGSPLSKLSEDSTARSGLFRPYWPSGTKMLARTMHRFSTAAPPSSALPVLWFLALLDVPHEYAYGALRRAPSQRSSCGSSLRKPVRSQG